MGVQNHPSVGIDTVPTVGERWLLRGEVADPVLGVTLTVCDKNSPIFLWILYFSLAGSATEETKRV